MSKSKPTIERRDSSPDELVLPEWNPREISERQLSELKRSIQDDPEFLQARPIIVSTRTGENVVVAGNMRVRAARSLGMKTIPVVFAELTEEKEKKWALLDNLHRGSWDFNILAAEFDILFLRDVGFDPKDLAKILGKQDHSDDDDFDPEQAKKETTGSVKKGEIWALGPHRLICADSTEEKSYKALLGANRAQLVFTDPPYNIGYTGGPGSKRKEIANDKMGKFDFQRFLNSFIKAAMPYSDGCWYVCMSPKELGALKEAFEGNGGHWQSTIIWAKNTFTLSGADWQNQYEPILYGWKDGIERYFAGWRDEANVWQDIEKAKARMEDGYTVLKLGDYHLRLEGEVKGTVCKKKEQTDIWKEKKPRKSGDHPTMKPVALVEKAILASSEVEKIVLDPFLGSGTTLIACENTKRVCYGIEMDEQYCEVIIRRYEEKTGLKAEKL